MIDAENLDPEANLGPEDEKELDDDVADDDDEDLNEWDDEDQEDWEDDYDDDDDDFDDEEARRSYDTSAWYNDRSSDPDEYLIDGVGFQDPGGNSALRRATKTNPRNRPCPTCGRKNVLTPLDVAAGYQCDTCADAIERGGP